jgi:hypothetical protein
VDFDAVQLVVATLTGTVQEEQQRMLIEFVVLLRQIQQEVMLELLVDFAFDFLLASGLIVGDRNGAHSEHEDCDQGDDFHNLFTGRLQDQASVV